MSRGNNEIPDWYLRLEQRYLEACCKKEEAEKEIASIKETVMNMMEIDGIDRIMSDNFLVKIRQQIFQKRFDVTTFKEKYPDLYSSYLKLAEYKKCVIFKDKNEYINSIVKHRKRMK